MTRTELVKVLLKALPIVARDGVGVVGVLLVVHGVGRIYEPAGWIIGGMVLIAYALLSARGARK